MIHSLILNEFVCVCGANTESNQRERKLYLKKKKPKWILKKKKTQKRV